MQRAFENDAYGIVLADHCDHANCRDSVQFTGWKARSRRFIRSLMCDRSGGSGGIGDDEVMEEGLLT